MDFRRRASFCLLTLALCVGCRQNNAQRELLERELRFQEDRIYELEADLETARRELSRYCATPSPGMPSSSFMPPTATFDAHPAPSTQRHDSPSASNHTPTVDLPLPTLTRKETVSPYGGPPVIMPPDPNVPEGLPGRTVTPGASSLPIPKDDVYAPPPVERNVPLLKPMSSPKFVSPSMKPRFNDENEIQSEAIPRVMVPQVKPVPAQVAPQPNGARVTSLTFGKRTGGLNLDGRPGDDGILVVLEPRTARGEVVSESGDLSIALIDPAVPGEGGRYARWDFTQADAAALFKPAGSDGPAGVHLELPWPEAAPQHTRLKLFVRMQTPDGRQLEFDRDILVQLVDGATEVMPTPFTPTPAPPLVLPVTAPVPESRMNDSVPALSWGRSPQVRPTSPPPEPAILPSLPAGSPESPLRANSAAGPSLGPAIMPAAPR